MKNSELIRHIVKTLEQTHPNLYHNVSENEIKNHIDSIKGIDNLTTIQFDYELLKLFALFKESHTCYYPPYEFLNYNIIFKNKKLYIYDSQEWKEIAKIDKLSTNEFLKRLEPLICYETEEWLSKMITDFANNGYIYKMLGLSDNDFIELTTVNDERLLLSTIKSKNSSKSRIFYYYKNLNDDILYLRYERCFDNPDFPFNLLVKQIEKDVKEKEINRYILDIRGNRGGNSEVLNPFQELVKNNDMKGCLLIDEGVFSSGIFAVMRFKKNFNATLIGQPTGGTAKHYGYVKGFDIEGKHFNVSTKLFDFSKFFGYEKSIKPDIFVEETIDDVQNNRDVTLNKAVEFMETEELSTIDKSPDFV